MIRLPILPQRWREPLLWTAAAAAGLLTAWASRGWLDARAEATARQLEQRYRSREVVVARQSLPPGTLLDAADLALRRMPADYLPSSSVLPEQAGALRGRVLEHAIGAGEVVQTALLRPVREVPLAERVPLGRRAMTIAVDETAGLAGLLRPGDRVDLQWREAESRAARALHNVEVLAAGDRLAAGIGEAGERYATLTLQLDPRQAAVLAGASGRVAVSLRNPRDADAVLEGRRALTSAGPAIALIVGGHGGPVPAVRALPELPR